MIVDYIIIGQGISGTLLSFKMMQQNISHVVIDHSKPYTASKVASGVINPITGRRFVKTWMIDELMPFAKNTYKSIEQLLNISIFQETSVLDFHTTEQMQRAFDERAKSETVFLNTNIEDEEFNKYFSIENGLGEIAPCYLIDLNVLIESWRNYLLKKEILIDSIFDEDEVIIDVNKVNYKNIEAKKIIYCNGVKAMQSKWFQHLPFAPNKGEALIVEILSLPKNHLYKNGITIVPWKENLFWVGSSYEWNYENENPSKSFKEKIETVLNEWLKMPFKIKEHLSSLRPTNTERRPFVGVLQHLPQIGILNGMGTKGCSLAPYFANELVNHLLTNESINKEVDVNRFF